MESRYDDRRSKVKIRYDVMNIKNDFPILKSKKINELVYFDNASTTQKPKIVIDSIVDYYSNYNANIHRGSYSIAEKSTESYEYARNKIAQFINAEKDEIIFTSGTTQSINFIAYSYGNTLKNGDEIPHLEEALIRFSNEKKFLFVELKDFPSLKNKKILIFS